jgi:hypothetical protein
VVIVDKPEGLMVTTRAALSRIREVVGRLDGRGRGDDEDSD